MGRKTLSADVDLMSGATFGNRDGHIAYNGDIRFNLSDATAGTFNENGTVSIYEYWSKTLTFNGVLSGRELLSWVVLLMKTEVLPMC